MDRGHNPSEAELYFLDNAKNLALYGVHLHDAMDVTVSWLHCMAAYSSVKFIKFN